MNEKYRFHARILTIKTFRIYMMEGRLYLMRSGVDLLYCRGCLLKFFLYLLMVEKEEFVRRNTMRRGLFIKFKINDFVVRGIIETIYVAFSW
ncbi:hypothetical protein DMA11_19310 [Marinilabiliaceae bacterium JC017]|nr:hypothetical protein DMA11_19310 [Marinilabiliaceae bacterium JC017]